MPVNFLSEAERARFNSFPANLAANEIIDFFTLTDADYRQIPQTAAPANRLGFALHIVLLSFLGFHLIDFASVPQTVIDYLALQLKVEPTELENYAAREQTRTDHLRLTESYLGFRHPTDEDWLKVSEGKHVSQDFIKRLF